MIVTVSSGKGGVGKTTTALALAAILGADQQRHGLGTPVLLDLDPRSDATRGVGIQPGGNRYETLFAGTLNGSAASGLRGAEVQTEEGFAIVPGSPETAFLEARQFAIAGADDIARGVCKSSARSGLSSSIRPRASIARLLGAQSARPTS